MKQQFSKPTTDAPASSGEMMSRRGLLALFGRTSAVVLGGAMAVACTEEGGEDTGAELDCGGEAELDDAITGTVTDGLGQDWSPATSAERTAVPTSCWQCVARDGAIGYVEDGRLVKIEGNPRLLRTGGKLCARGQGGVGQVYDPDRLLFPMRRVAGTARGEHQWERITWDEALGELAERLAEVRAEDPKYLMFHYGRMKASSSKMTKTYFLPAFGSKTYAGHTSICEATKWTGQELVWGKHYDINDVSRSNVILCFGSNPMVAHTSHIPFVQRLTKAVAQDRIKLYTFDPRMSETAARSTKWLPIKPGTDLAVVLAMAYHIVTRDLVPDEGRDFINRWTNIDPGGFDSRLERLADVLMYPDAYIADQLDADPALVDYWQPDDQPPGGYTPAWAEQVSGVPATEIIRIAEEYAAGSPGSSIISYRGAVMHWNGAYCEMAIQLLEGLCGNIDVPGGRVHAVAAKWNYSSTYPKPSNSTSGLKVQNDHHFIAPTHHASHQVLSAIRDADVDGRPKIYFVYCYTPAYANGDIQENIDILKDESILPYIVVSDTSYTEAVMYGDLVLPDTTYLERWDWEDNVSYDQIHEYYIRQPVVEPLGEVRNLQDVWIELARMLSEGGDDPLEQVAAIGSMENFVKAACNDTEAVNAAGIARGYADGFEFMKAEGAWYDPDEEPKYLAYLDEVDVELTDPDLVEDTDEGLYIFQDDEGIVWECTKAELNTGYRRTKDAYKRYVGQVIDDSGIVYKGFAPDKANKSGFFELESKILEAGHYPALPVWMPIPEHREPLAANELYLSTFKLATQTHSRTQNCKLLTELDHHNPAWINPTTASDLGIADGDEVKLSLSRALYNAADRSDSRGVATGAMTVEVKVTHAIRPGVISISHSLGHWAYGRYASGTKSPLVDQDTDYDEHGALDPDKDAAWWKRFGYRSNWLMPNAGDPVGGGLRYFDVIVTVEKA